MSTNSTTIDENGGLYKKPFLTKKETANLLSVDISTLWNWHQKGILKPIGLGGRVYYRMIDIEKALVQL